jgi:hypothetical protein
MGNKINKLFLSLSEGAVCSSAWLQNHGYYIQLVQRYCKSGRLLSVARGAFRRPGREPEWQDIVVSLNHFWGPRVHVGGLSALELSGLGQYIKLGSQSKIALFYPPHLKLPAWIGRLPAGRALDFNKDSLFTQAPTESTIAALEWPKLPWPMPNSCPERAALEMLFKTPLKTSFEHASEVFRGLVNLRPELVQALLFSCKNVQAKRLFLYLAEYHNMPWFAHLKVKDLDLGKGNRVIVKGGKLDTKYRITVPKNHAEL